MMSTLLEVNLKKGEPTQIAYNLLFNIHKLALMLEAIVGRRSVSLHLPKKDAVETTKPWQFISYMYKLQNDLLALEKHLTTEQKKLFREYLKASDYTVYTDVNYRRKFWNEIPLFIEVEDYFNLFSELFNKNTSGKERTIFLHFYDFNDLCFAFSSEKEVEKFVSKYDVAPAYAYSEEEGELWSI